MAMPGEDRPQTVPDAPPGDSEALGEDSLVGNVKTWAVGGHLAAFVWLVGIPGPIGPLIVWLLKRGDHPFIDDQAKEALNFQLSILIYQVTVALAVFLLLIPTGGLDILPGLAVAGLAVILTVVIVIWLVAIVFAVIAAYNASEGEGYRYPLTIRFIS